MAIPTGPEIIASRLQRLNTQLLATVDVLTEEEASTWPTSTAPSCKWHLWHMARWADYVQALLPPVGLEETCELWESEQFAEKWRFNGIDLGMWGAGSGLGNKNGRSLPLPNLPEVRAYAKKVFNRLEIRVGKFDELSFNTPFTDWHDVDTSIGDAMVGYLAHANRHLGMLEAISGVLGKDGSVTV